MAVLEDMARTPLTTALLSLAAKAMGLGSLLDCLPRVWLHHSAVSENCTARCKFSHGRWLGKSALHKLVAISCLLRSAHTARSRLRSL